MTHGIYHFNLGDFSCTVFQDAIDTRPLEFLTTSVPNQEVSQALKSLGLPVDQVGLMLFVGCAAWSPPCTTVSRIVAHYAI